MPTHDDTEFLSPEAIAFGEKLGKSRELLTKVGYLLTGDVERTKDLVGETYLKAWRAHEQYQGRNDASVETWLIKILVNANRNRHRTAGRKPVIPLEDGEGYLFEPSVQPSQFEHMQSVELQEHIGRIRDPQRRNVVQMTLQGYSGEEIAVHTDVKPGTVRTRYSRSVDDLAELYGLTRGQRSRSAEPD